MCKLCVGVAVFPTLGERDDMINMEISTSNGIATDAANALVALEKDLSIYLLDKLLSLAGFSF